MKNITVEGPSFLPLPKGRYANMGRAVMGAHTILTREPDSIDLFAAKTGVSLAETVNLQADRLAPKWCNACGRSLVERLDLWSRLPEVLQTQFY